MAEQSDPERQKAELEPHNTDATYNDDETEDDVITFIDPEEQEMLTASRLDDDEMEAVAREEEDRNSALAQEQEKLAKQQKLRNYRNIAAVAVAEMVVSAILTFFAVTVPKIDHDNPTTAASATAPPAAPTVASATNAPTPSPTTNIPTLSPTTEEQQQLAVACAFIGITDVAFTPTTHSSHKVLGTTNRTFGKSALVHIIHKYKIQIPIVSFRILVIVCSFVFIAAPNVFGFHF